MITEKLVREREIETKDLNEAVELANTDFLVEPVGIDLKDINLNEDGIIDFGNTGLPISEWAFDNLCRLLTIPNVFARSIPFELLQLNINKLKKENNKRIIILISKETVVNVVPHPYMPARNRDVLDRLEGIMKTREFGINRVGISDRGVSVSLLSEKLKAEPVPNDITRFGLSIMNSETGYKGAVAKLFALRLICSNGAELSEVWGKVRWSYDNRISRERSLSNFFEGILNLHIDFDKFTERYKRLPEHKLAAVDFVNSWRRLSRLVGKEEADRITGVPTKERNYFEREVREGDRMLSTGLIYYDFYNHITEAAKRYPFIQRIGLERLGGSLIDLAAQ